MRHVHLIGTMFERELRKCLRYCAVRQSPSSKALWKVPEVPEVPRFIGANSGCASLRAMNITSVRCGSCGASLPGAGTAGLGTKTSCHVCGSTTRTIGVELEAQVQVRDSLKALQKRPGIKRPLVELFSGWDLRRSVGDFVKKIRRLDRAADRYQEHVETEGGEVLRSVDEKLTEHIGHGSDRAWRDTGAP